METATQKMDWRGIDLTPFTEPEACRYALTAPWRGDDGRGFVTDGRLLLEFDDGSVFDEPNGKVPNCDEVMQNFDTLAEYAPLPDPIEGPPEGADLWWNTGSECRYCKGTGEIDCEHCGTCDDCQHCDEGRIGGEYWGSISPRGLDVGDAYFDRRYLWLLSQLPAARCRVNGGQDGTLDVVFDGGRGRLMPMERGSA